MPRTLELIDTAANPFLSGRFAPVRAEVDAAELVVEGDVPTDLTGAYLRNGANPQFTPLGSYTYPLEGDGMVHAVSFDRGHVRYRNRWVRTAGFAAERRAGRALFGGLMTPSFVDASQLGTDPDPGWPFKLDTFINVVRHAGHLLALGEGVPPYELDGALGTVGRFDWRGSLPGGCCAHPRVDRATGEMIVFRYDVRPPYLTWATLGPDGSLRRPETAIEGVEACFMVHDCVITPRYLLLVVGPAVIDTEAMLTGGEALSWRPELGTRIAVVPRNGPGAAAGAVRWVHTDSFWVWHFANAYEDGDTVVVDFPWWDRPGFARGAPGAPIDGKFTRAVVDVGRATVSLTALGPASEFPRIDDRLTGSPHRYVTVTARSDNQRLAPSEHDRLVQHDMVSGAMATYDTHAAIGEVAFAPRDGATGELDGYYLTFGTLLSDPNASWLYIWEAGDFPARPRARVRCPQRVPNGLHGNWFAADDTPTVQLSAAYR